LEILSYALSRQEAEKIKLLSKRLHRFYENENTQEYIEKNFGSSFQEVQRIFRTDYYFTYEKDDKESKKKKLQAVNDILND